MLTYSKVNENEWVAEAVSTRNDDRVQVARIERLKYIAPSASIGYVVRFNGKRYDAVDTLEEAKGLIEEQVLAFLGHIKFPA